MNRRCVWARVALCLACALLFHAVPARAQTEAIVEYHSNVDLNEDASLLVNETIRVIGAGNQIRHGIYRDFPTRYTDRLGNRYTVGFELIRATRDGQPEQTRVEDRNNGKRIYLGRSNYMLPPGDHTYTIAYRTNRQLGFFRDHDELFWNVTGNGWIFPIYNASATVHLPVTIRADQVTLNGYTGPQRSMAHYLVYRSAPDGSFEFDTARPLRAHEGLTILLMWPKGFIAEPTREQKVSYFFQDNRDALIGGGGLAVIFLYYLAAWFSVGRDRAPGTIVALYEPPPGFSPAATRYLTRMAYDNKAFASAVVDMAVKGYVQIKEQNGTYTLYRTKADGAGLTPDEKTVADILFDGGDEIWLHNENHGTISAAIAALKKWLKTTELKIYFLNNSGYMIPALVLSALLVVGLVAGQGGPKVVMAAFMCVWLSIWSMALVGLILGVVNAWKASFEGGHVTGGLAAKAAMLTLFSLPFLGGEAMGIAFFVLATSVSVAATVFGAIALHALFHHLLKAPTRAGRAVLDKVEGFKMFLGAVEADPMRRAMPPDRTPETFEKFLPYAMALGVEKAWADKFSGVIDGASKIPGGTNGYSPGWYSGPGWSNFGAAGFASSLAGSFSGAISSSASAPGSAGGGGGGSGGGGGGGGGGGW
jgi:hypothetical protein